MNCPKVCGDSFFLLRDGLWPQTDVLCDDCRSLLVYLSCFGGSQWDLTQDSGPESCLLKMTPVLHLSMAIHWYIKDTHEKGLCNFP